MIRLVVKLFNHRLIERVEREVPHCRVLDVAALAAPVFAFAGLYDDILHCVDVPGGRFLLRQWSGQVPASAQVVAVRRQTAPLPPKPGPLAELPPEDWLFLPRGTGSLERHEVAFALSPSDEGIPSYKYRRVRFGVPTLGVLWQGLRRLLSGENARQVLSVLAFLTALGILSAVIFQHALGLRWYQAIYFVITIMTTTGFGDIALRHAPPAVVLYGTGLMLVGAMVMAVLYAILTDFLLSNRLAPLIGTQVMALKGHFILCGFGKVGFRIALELRAMGFAVVAIEKQEHSRLVERARRRGIRVVVTPDLYGALQALRVEHARGVIAVTDDDMQNMELSITVQDANPRARVVIRLFDSHLASLVERTFGLHLARSPSAIAAPAFAIAALADDLLDAFELGDVLWCVGRLYVTEDHPLHGRPVRSLTHERILPLTLSRDKENWKQPVAPDLVLRAGDALVVLTPRPTWLALQGAPPLTPARPS